MIIKKKEKNKQRSPKLKSYVYEGVKPFTLVVKGETVVLEEGDEVTMSEGLLKTNKMKKFLKEKET